MKLTRGLPQHRILSPSNLPLGIGERDFPDYCHTASFFTIFKGVAPSYLKTAVWKGITGNLKLDLMDNLIKAINGNVIFRRDRSHSRTIICELSPEIYDSNGSKYITKPTIAAQVIIKKSKSVTIQFFSTETEVTKTYITDKLLPKLNKIIEPYTSQPEDSNLVNISFCMHSMDGANIMNRQLHCPSWEEVINNYPYSKNEIKALFEMENPDRHGKFIFWHGPPGTGKSYLIRAALQKWKMNVRCMYIVDPENFFNNANYMQEVLLHRPTDADEDDDMWTTYDDEEYEESPEGSKFRLMIIEDGLNNLLTETRNEREGAVSRFLNLTDGILGQGLRLIFLVTSNEKVTKIDDAFLRTGRCLQELEFPEFDIKEAKKWLSLKEKKVLLKLPKKSMEESYSLAKLYSYLTEDSPNLSKKSEETKVGFI